MTVREDVERGKGWGPQNVAGLSAELGYNMYVDHLAWPLVDGALLVVSK
jgi:hypothetical protein